MEDQIIVGSSDSFFEIISDFKKIFTSDVDTLQEIASDESVPFIKRKLIGMMTSDDEAMALKSIQWIHELILSSTNIQMKERNAEIDINTGTFILTKKQKAIYTKLKKDAESSLIGDDYLYKILAINIDHYNQANAILNYTGFKMEYKTGAQQIRPEVTVLREADRNIQKLIGELGLSSVTRYKAGIQPKPKAKATLTSLLQQKAQ